MKVFADHHHDDLYESLRILFEDRLGFEMYRPIGPSWYHEGFWEVYNHPETVVQYLGLHIGAEFIKKEQDAAGHFPWMNRDNDGGNDGIYTIPGRGHNKAHRAITLERFKNTKFDIIISSIPAHFSKFEKLISLYQPHAKHIFQMGNAWSPPAHAKNILNSTTVAVPSTMNHVRYHQEFDLNIFKPLAITDPKVVINMQHYMHDKNTFRALESMMAGWSFKEHGAGNREGPVELDKLPQTIRSSGFIYHVKHGGEGFGYNIHHAYACGKPMIIKSSLYRGLTAAPLFVDGQTCIDLDGKSMQQVKNMLEQAATNYPEWSARTYTHFQNIVNFDHEFQNIKAFIENLK